jgi:hypothetical protein
LGALALGSPALRIHARSSRVTPKAIMGLELLAPRGYLGASIAWPESSLELAA